MVYTFSKMQSLRPVHSCRLGLEVYDPIDSILDSNLIKSHQNVFLDIAVIHHH